LQPWKKICGRQATFSLTAEKLPETSYFLAEAWASPLSTFGGAKLLHDSFCFAKLYHQPPKDDGIIQEPNRVYSGQPFHRQLPKYPIKNLPFRP